MHGQTYLEIGISEYSPEELRDSGWSCDRLARSRIPVWFFGPIESGAFAPKVHVALPLSQH
jgi:hypothetical protein